jgi:hypothetical protein
MTAPGPVSLTVKMVPGPWIDVRVLVRCQYMETNVLDVNDHENGAVMAEFMTRSR